MCASSSATTSASQQQTIQQLLQKATSPTPQQANNQTLKNTQNASDKPPETNTPNTSGSRGTQVNIQS